MIACGMNDKIQPQDLPYVPDLVIIKEGDRYWSLKKDQTLMDIGIIGYKYLLDNGEIYAIHEEKWVDNHWISVEESKTVLFSLEEENKWRGKRAQELLAQTNSIKNNPEKVISMIRASGLLVNIKVPGLIKNLESQRKSADETLSDIFQRVKK